MVPWRWGRGLEKSPPDYPQWSLSTISKANRWIRDCVEQAGHCKERKSSTGASSKSIAESTEIEDLGGRILPTRLLDLSPDLSSRSDDATSDDIVLFETASLRGQEGEPSSQTDNLRYAALSYCWGGVDPTAKTTNANFKHGCRTIEFSSLPQCLKDAVAVTRSLGVRYLWVDALCIIQGDADDWAREAGTMFSVFRNAYVTIGAALSPSFDDGFLKHRPRKVEIPFSSSCNPQVRGKITLSTISSPTSEPEFFPDVDPLERDLAESKWDTRGWVWQEQMLSKRILIFGNEMLHFKCTHGVQSEDSTDFHDSHTLGDQTRQQWTRWVERFSKMQLTYIQDKLPAVSGLAKMMDQKSSAAGEGPAEYLAGIWRSSQETENHKGWRGQLCWSLSDQASTFKQMLKGLKSTTPETYSAPSWSWASRREAADWEVTEFNFLYNYAFRQAPQRFQAQFEEYHGILMGPDPMGRVMPSSYLKLSGLMCQTPLPVNTAEPRGGRAVGEWMIPSFSPFFSFSFDWKHSPNQDDEPIEGDIRLFGLWRSTIQGFAHFSGLLLLRDDEDDFFYRVGTFHLQKRLDDDGHGRGPMLEEYVNFFVDWEQTSVSIK